MFIPKVMELSKFPIGRLDRQVIVSAVGKCGMVTDITYEDWLPVLTITWDNGETSTQKAENLNKVFVVYTDYQEFSSPEQEKMISDLIKEKVWR